MSNLANVEELRVNSEAIEIYLSSSFDKHIKIKSAKELIKGKKFYNSLLEVIKIFPTKKQNYINDKRYKKNYNFHLNRLLSVLNDSSELHNLLFIDQNLKYIKKKDPIQKEYLDIWTNTPIVNNSTADEYILHVKSKVPKKTMRIKLCDESLMSMLRTYMERCKNFSNLFEISESSKGTSKKSEKKNTKLGTYNILRKMYGLRIDLPDDYFVNSDDSRLIHLLCGGNPPKSNDTPISVVNSALLYPLYTEFMNFLEKTIRHIIAASYNDSKCPYTVVPCCRVEPPCSTITIGYKPVSGQILKNLNCSNNKCRLGLCSGGCGRVYHGESPCTDTFDEASQRLIRSSTKTCPKCLTPTIKANGCNHMTCKCGCQYCWLCLHELPLDERGHYSVERHFNRDLNGLGVQGGCDQGI